MQMPEKLILKQRSSYRMGWVVMFICLFIVALVLVMAVVFTRAKPDDLVLPVVTASAMALFVAAIIWIGVAISVSRERRAIQKLLEGELWAQWQYTPQEWQREVQDLREAEKRMFKPGYNLILGLVFGAILAAVALYLHNPQYTPMILFVAGIVTLIFFATGFFLPMYYHRRTAAYYRQLSQFESPHVFIGESGLYHEAKGFTSFKRLSGVEYLSGSPATIIFSIIVSGGEGMADFALPVPVPVPAKYVGETQALVGRFRGGTKV
jgi:hypothetical protein